jgi:hypothetical protein
MTADPAAAARPAASMSSAARRSTAAKAPAPARPATEALPSTRAISAAPIPEASVASTARGDTLAGAARVDAAGPRADDARGSERPSLVPILTRPAVAPAAPRVHIGRLEVIVVAPAEPAVRPAPRDRTAVSSRRYLRNA